MQWQPVLSKGVSSHVMYLQADQCLQCWSSAAVKDGMGGGDRFGSSRSRPDRTGQYLTTPQNSGLKENALCFVSV